MSYPKMGLTFNQFQEANQERCQESFHKIDDWTDIEWLNAAFGELGEAANMMKKRLRLHTSTAQGNTSETESSLTEEDWIDEIAEEIADTITYLDLLLTKMGRSTGNEIVKKFNKVNRRIGYHYDPASTSAPRHTILYRDLANPDD